MLFFVDRSLCGRRNPDENLQTNSLTDGSPGLHQRCVEHFLCLKFKFVFQMLVHNNCYAVISTFPILNRTRMNDKFVQLTKWMRVTFVHVTADDGEDGEINEMTLPSRHMQDSKFKIWWSEGEHATSGSLRLPTIKNWKSRNNPFYITPNSTWHILNKDSVKRQCWRVVVLTLSSVVDDEPTLEQPRINVLRHNNCILRSLTWYVILGYIF